MEEEADGRGCVVHVPVSKLAERLREPLRAAGARRADLFLVEAGQAGRTTG